MEAPIRSAAPTSLVSGPAGDGPAAALLDSRDELVSYGTRPSLDALQFVGLARVTAATARGEVALDLRGDRGHPVCLAPMGESLGDMVFALAEWSRDHKDAVAAARSPWDQEHQ